MSKGLGEGDEIKEYDTFSWFRSMNDDLSAGRRNVPLYCLKDFMAKYFADLEEFKTVENKTALLEGRATELESRAGTLENMIAVNTLRDSVDAGWTILDMIDGIADEYEDETGINGANTTAARDAEGNNYGISVTGETTLIQSVNQANDSSLFVDEGALISVTAQGGAVHTTAITANSGTSCIDLTSSRSIRLGEGNIWDVLGGDFTIKMIIRFSSVSGNQVLLETGESTNRFLFWVTGGNLTLTWYNGSLPTTIIQNSGGFLVDTWYEVGVVREANDYKMFIDNAQVGPTVTDGKEFSAITGEATIASQFGGQNQFNGYLQEMYFRNGFAEDLSISTTGHYTLPTGKGNWVVESSAYDSESIVEFARLVVLYESPDSISLNTDIKVFISTDGGATYTTTEATLENDGAFNSTVDILTTGDIDLSALPSDTDLVYKIESFNNKSQKIHGTWLQWR